MKDISYLLKVVWSKTLVKLFNKINNEIATQLKTTLKVPIFEIFSNKNKTLGYWSVEKGVLGICSELFLSYEKAAVEYVLRHEMAHQIVTDIFKERAKPHGETFKRACKVVSADSNRILNTDNLLKFASNKDKKIILKIKKIMAKGNCESATEKEAEAFLKKAQDLILKYNLSQQTLKSEDKVFISRPVGKLLKVTPSHYWDIGHILKNHYFVKVIRSEMGSPFFSYYYVKNYYFVLFGEPSNLDIAEYIFDALLLQGERLWSDFKKEKKAAGERISGNYSKKAFLEGVYEGYDEKLSKDKEVILKQCDESMNSLIKIGDSILNEKYQNEFPNMSSVSRKYSTAGGYNDGLLKGKNMRIPHAIKSSKSKGKLLT